ncbi:MAG: HDOD domain-containing protein [Deltaproteobacteria bacterium]|nr:HDOD domain-containing protein [Deltaproteobacteria bacterium]
MPKQTIPSGDYFVGPSRPVLLQAFLGTCVGVAVFDAKSGVGGMIHLLLPEPAGFGREQADARYASTGMPLFLTTLYEAGAVQEQLTAVIAGGALVGPLNATDLDLNIGGRTAEVVESILAAEGIPIVHSETGGFFTCCLRLDMENWTFRIEPLGQEKDVADQSGPLPDPAEIQRAAAKIKPIPQVALKILHMIDAGIDDIQPIAAEIKKDQVLSARTLQLCNSAMFAKTNRIESLDHALVFLGENLFVRMIISAAVNEFFDAAGNGYSLCMGGLFHHAVGTALTAEKIAHFTGKVPVSTAYTGGLLHDIGKVVLDQFIASAYPLFYRKLNCAEAHSIKIEREIFGTDHAAVGRELAEMWSFPESLRTTIAHHHEPEKSLAHTELAHIVFLADLLMARFNTGLELEGMSSGSIENRLHRLGLQPGDLAEVIDLIPQTLFNVEAQTTPAFGG